MAIDIPSLFNQLLQLIVMIIRLPFSLLVKLGVSQQIVDLLWQALLFIIAVRLIVFIFKETTIKNICAFAAVLLIILVVLEFHGMI